MRVEVAWVAPKEQTLVALDLRTGATVEDAVSNATPALLAGVKSGELRCAIYGRRVDLATPLADDDRVEITRPLACDPKLARRRRAAGAG
jgi:putative ubiquitin-RnfH superfamily antitoxin RatB of RatAB toxin-antitoxin module